MDDASVPDPGLKPYSTHLQLQICAFAMAMALMKSFVVVKQFVASFWNWMRTLSEVMPAGEKTAIPCSTQLCHVSSTLRTMR